MAGITYPHIDVQSDGTVILSGTQTKVVEIVLDRLAHHWDADEIQRQHPHLSLAQIHAALAYYYDHQEALDREIEAQLQDVEKIRSAQGPSAVRRKLGESGNLP